ncbi:TonB-dependent receptor domain-containing protein [Chitinophaga sancti]|uniref:TonB-dependent receptor n=1 Tax=Chitinophaga sancti TaxID=1004 RepID=UPI003F7B114C
MRLFMKCCLLASMVMGFFSPVMAGIIKGTVREENGGGSIAGVTVKIIVNQKVKYTATDLDGEYEWQGLAPGTYQLTFSMMGYQPVTKSVTVNEGLSRLNVSLAISARSISGVTVKGSTSRESEQDARKSERNAAFVMNIIPAKTIQLLPDITVAGVLQRVSGVSVERSSTGNAQYAIIRGMDKRYNYTLVNGIKLPSPDHKNRYLPMDLFPAELLERLEVIKALTPEMEGDAVGGVMNLQMKNAPDQALFTATAATGFNELFTQRSFMGFDKGVVAKRSPREQNGGNYSATGKDFPVSNLKGVSHGLPFNQLLSASAGNRFLPAKELGVIVSGSYQHTFTGSNSLFFQPNGQPDPEHPNNGNNPNLNNLQNRHYSTEQQRMALYMKADYRINGANVIDWTNMLLQLNEFQYRTSNDTVFDINSSGPGNRLAQHTYRSRSTYQTIFNSTLHGKDAITAHLKADWTLSFSNAVNKMPDWSDFYTAFQVTTDANANVSTSPELLQPMTRIWAHNSDRDLSGYGNLTYHTNRFTLTAGGMYRHKQRDNFYITYKLNAATANEQFSTIDNVLYEFQQSGEGKGQYPNANSYAATENVAGAYLMLSTQLTKHLEMLTGIRAEQTLFNFQTSLPPTSDGTFGSLHYTDLLPSLHLTYKLHENQNIRLSYFSSISRPGFYEYLHYEPGDFYDESGNIHLKHTTANNLDLRYELFPKGQDQLLVGVFYKHLTNPIEYALEPQTATSSVLKPENFGNATNYGAEIVYTKYIREFGLSFNYTYTQSAITTNKSFYYRDPGTNSLTTKQVSQTRPLQNQSAHIGNLSLIYKGVHSGLDAQLAVVYTGPRIVFVSPYYGLDYWQKGITQLDFSFEKKLLRRVAVYGKVNNLLNVPYTVEIHQSTSSLSQQDIPYQQAGNNILVQRDYYGRNYLLGLRYKL